MAPMPAGADALPDLPLRLEIGYGDDVADNLVSRDARERARHHLRRAYVVSRKYQQE